MKKRLIIVGAGGLGREIFGYLHAQPNLELEVAGFIDDSPSALTGHQLPVGVLGSVVDYLPRPTDIFIPGIGAPKEKLRICHSLRTRGAKFYTFVHPSAIVGYQSTLGSGVFIFPGAVVAPYATIGDFVTLGTNATVGHDARIYDGCTLSGHTEINGNSELAEGVFMGSHATVLPRVKIGEYAILGAGSVSIAAVKPRTTMFAMPAKRLSDGT